MKKLLLFFALLCYFYIWVVAKPIFHAPDEYAHLIKIYSVPTNLWVSQDKRVSVRSNLINPLFYDKKIHSLIFHPERKLKRKNFRKFKGVRWDKKPKDQTEVIVTNAFSYPNLYYGMLYLFGNTLTQIFDLSPYNSFYLYRLISGFFAAFLWLWVYQVLGKIKSLERYKKIIFGFVVLNPMLGFITASLNPDAFFNPLAHLVMLYSYFALVENSYKNEFFLTMLLAGFVKPAALILYPSLTIMATLAVFWDFKRSKIVVSNYLLYGLLPSLIVFFSFYFWSPAKLFGTGVSITLSDYIINLGDRVDNFFVMFWGRLGWLDYGARDIYYIIIAILAGISSLLCIPKLRKISTLNASGYLFLFSLIFIVGTLGGEFVYYKDAGPTIQGRYFLPISLGLFMIFSHKQRWFSFSTLMYLVFFNGVLFWESLLRYFAGNWKGFISSLPFLPWNV